MDAATAQTALRRKFQPYVAVDVSSLVVGTPAETAATQNAALTAWLEAQFDPRWADLCVNPGGTMGHHTAFVQAKADWLSHSLDTALQDATAPEAVGLDSLDSALAQACLGRLHRFWQEWAGYHLTASDEYAALLNAGE